MKTIIVAGTPSVGKTSVLLYTLRELKAQKVNCAVVKIDCLQTDDARRFGKLEIPIKVGISGDMCPDHYFIYNIEECQEWAQEQLADVLFIETAGLCLRCAPYTNNCLAICIVDATSGPNTPLKIGPLVTTADVIATTKGDLISQAEREVFRERICEINPTCKLIEANGLNGKGSAEIADIVIKYANGENKETLLRHTPPLAICTLCTGELRTNRQYHSGILRNLKGEEKYDGE